MILVNTDYISGKEFEMLGLVKGSTIQSKHVGKDIAQSFKTLVGGESHMIKCEVYVPPPPPEEDSGSIGISQTMFFLILALLFFIF